jgi:hypothetical protein
LLLGDLLQRDSLAGAQLAYRVAQGEALYRDQRLRPRDPEAVIRFGTALLSLRDDTTIAVAVESASAGIPASQVRRARERGRVLGQRFVIELAALSSAASQRVPSDECVIGWPGTPSNLAVANF